MDQRLFHLLRLVGSALQLARHGDEFGSFDAAFDILVRAWCHVAHCEHPHALMTTAVADVAAQALVVAFEAHGVGRPREWIADITARVGALSTSPRVDELTQALIALGEHRPGCKRLDPARADAALDVAAAAIALGCAWYNDAPAPAQRRLAPVVDVELSLMETL